MTVRKKGSRRIVVDGVEYLWRFPRRPASGAWDGTSGFTVAIQRADRTGSVLALCIARPHPTIIRLWGSSVFSLLPSQVAAAIRQALEAGWQPGELGSDFGLTVDPKIGEPYP